MRAGVDRGQGGGEGARETRAEAVAPRTDEVPALAPGKDGDSSPALQELLAGAPDPARLARVIAAHPRERERLLAACHQHFGNAVVSAILADPALAAPRVDADGAGGEAALRNLAGETITAQPQQTPQAPAKDSAAKRLEKQPTGVSGPDGEAAWLALAADIGFLTIEAPARKQLDELAAGKGWVNSYEKNPGAGHRHRIPGKVEPGQGAGNSGYGNYAVKLDTAPILSVLVALLRTRIKGWESAGGGAVKSLLNIGMLVRGDPGYIKGSPHREGQAVDLHGKFSNDKDVIGVLKDLDPAKIGSVFPDYPEHLHIQIIDGRYHFGMPFGAPFFPAQMNFAVELPKLEKAASPGDTLHAAGMYFFNPDYFELTGRYDAAKREWVWTPTKVRQGGARAHLQSGALEAALKQLHSAGAGGTPGAPKQGALADDTDSALRKPEPDEDAGHAHER